MSLRADKNLPLVVIFGRTNVGKSTLFNCLTEKRQALVSPLAGTTRDSNLGQITWRGRKFNLVDTGGIIDLKYLLNQTKIATDIESKVQLQAKKYLRQADLVIFLTDGKAGLLPADRQMAILIKKTVEAKKVILTVNKIDSPKDCLSINEFYKLAMGQPLPVSAINGSGTGDLLDAIIKKLEFPKIQNHPPAGGSKIENVLNVCIIGQPNVGKSSLLNSLLGYERVITSSTPHTTREPQHTDIIYQDHAIRLIDTAGISRHGAKSSGLEKFGITKSLAALNKSDLALLVLDISQPITHQDAKLVEEIIDAKKSLIFLANKWDKIIKRETKKYSAYVYGKLPFAQFAPIQFISALTGEKVHPVRYSSVNKKTSLVELAKNQQLNILSPSLSNGVNKILNLVIRIGQERKLELSDSQLEHFLSRVVKIHRPAKGKGVRHPRLRDFRQIHANPPEFELRIGVKEDLHFSYIRFLENRLREAYGFLGTPLTIKIAKNRRTLGLYKD